MLSGFEPYRRWVPLVTVPTESTLASDYIRKKLSPLPELTALMHAFSACANSDSCVLNELTRMGEVKCY